MGTESSPERWGGLLPGEDAPTVILTTTIHHHAGDEGPWENANDVADAVDYQAMQQLSEE